LIVVNLELVYTPGFSRKKSTGFGYMIYFL